ncbi:MAG: hypothetical protein H6813_05215 [Phycisphaeraceae bacterium]|nr:hypothetical protein [Phycisphaeraceae bacterium]MCB9847783.1 hypothetical protein [Phycisphaeraceae bacterium]
MSCRFTALLALVCATAALAAQPTRVAFTVITVSGRSVFINVGRDAGVTPGALVTIDLAGGGRIESVVREVSATNSRVDIPDGVELPAVDDRGEILLTPSDEPVQETPPSKQEEAPEHPPWMRKEEARTEDQPLLAPAFSTDPRDRPTEVHGRAYAQLRFTHDSGGGRNNDFFYTRAGTSFRVTNPFKRGGELQFSGDIDYRGADLLSSSESDADLRIDRLNYTIGGHEHSPYRLQLGRFYSKSVPEIGLIDGVEGALQLEGGWRLGTGVGFYPVPFPDRDTGEDYGVHVFADYESGKERWFSSTIAYQQTWHDGEQDRNLIIGRFNSRPTSKLWFTGLALIDLYGSGDTIKNEDFGLTELLLTARYTPTKATGVSATYVHTTWPELKRREFANLPAELIRDGVVDRVNTSGWVRLTDDFRLGARANAWSDQDGNGYGGEISADWTDVWGDTSALHGAIYFNDNRNNHGVGLRLRARDRIGGVDVSAGYNGFRYTTEGLVGGDETTTRHALVADVSWSDGPWSYTVSASHRFGQNENSYSLGLYLNYRF